MDVCPADAAATADRLLQRRMEPIGQFAEASNATLLCHLAGPDDPPLAEGVSYEDLPPDELAVYKPRRGEAPLWDYPSGTLYRREVAAYEVSRLLGWHQVPVTVVRDDGPFGVGCVQQFVAHDPERHYFWMIEQGGEDLLEQLRRMVVFDLIIDNADRKGGHVLLDDDDRIFLVDHGVSFSTERKIRTVAWHFAGELVPGEIRAEVEGFVDRLTGAEGAGALGPLLADDEMAVLMARARAATALAVYPEPRGPRPYPWPLL